MPVKTSPEPAFAIELLPVLFTYFLPSGDTTTVLCDFNTTVALYFSEILIADLSKFDNTSSNVQPNSLAASLGCGVRITLSNFLSKYFELSFASKFKPSASITNGQSCKEFSITKSNKLLATSFYDNPQPIETTEVVLFK